MSFFALSKFHVHVDESKEGQKMNKFPLIILSQAWYATITMTENITIENL